MKARHVEAPRRSWDLRLTIRQRLAMLLLALALPFAVYLAVSAWRQNGEERRFAQQQMLALARITAARLDDHVGDIRQVLAVLSGVVGTTEADTEANNVLLQGLLPRLPEHIDNLTVWTADARNIGRLDPWLHALQDDIARRPFFVDARNGSPLAIEAPARSAAGGEPIGVFALPIVREGRTVGVVAASMQLRPLQELLAPHDSLPAGTVVTVSNAEGVVLARSVDPDQWIGHDLHSSGVIAASAPARREGTREGPGADGVDRVGGFTTARRVPWVIYVGMPSQTALARVHKRLAENVVVGVAMLLVGLVLAARVGGRIAAPLRRLSDDASALAQGDLSHRSDVVQGGEIGTLATALRRMAASLQERDVSLQASQDQLRQITDNLPVLISYLDPDQRFRFANRTYLDWLGMEPAGVLGRSLSELYGQSTYIGFRRHIEQALGGHRVVYERDIETVRGTRRVEVTALPHFRADSTVQGLFVLIQDVTENREAEAQRKRSEERLSLALEGSSLALFDWDIVNDRLYLSAQAQAMRGAPAEEANTSSLALVPLVHVDDLSAVQASLRAVITGASDLFESDFRVLTRSGDWIWLRGRARVVDRNAEGRALRLAGTVADISQRKEVEERLRQLAEFDTLTGLPNRGLFLDRLGHALARRARNGRPMALLFLDIDHFKSVNDTLGHETGDHLLRSFARTLRDSVRGSDTVGRLAGDEFTVILEDVGGLDEAQAVAAVLVAAVRQTVSHGDRHVDVTTSIGITLVADGETDTAAVLRRADAALYRAKAAGRDGFAFEPPPEPA